MQDLTALCTDHLLRYMIHIQIHGAVPFCSRIHRAVNVTDRSDDIFCHIPFIDCEILQIVYNAFVHFHCLFQVRIPVGDQISLSNPVKVAHTSVCATFDTDILPEIIIT